MRGIWGEPGEPLLCGVMGSRLECSCCHLRDGISTPPLGPTLFPGKPTLSPAASTPLTPSAAHRAGCPTSLGCCFSLQLHVLCPLGLPTPQSLRPSPASPQPPCCRLLPAPSCTSDLFPSCGQVVWSSSWLHSNWVSHSASQFMPLNPCSMGNALDLGRGAGRGRSVGL